MNLHENTDFGRKVFFICPPYSFKRTIVPSLFTMEYEVYIIEDYTRAKSVLKCYPDSICFICVDSKLSYNEWFNFVASFAHDQALSTIFLGILSARMPKAMREHFMLHTTIPAGFITLNQSTEDLINVMHEILELNGAMGRRHYIRANCRDSAFINAKFTIEGDKCLTLRLRDISSVGFVCIGTPAILDFFKMNMLIRGFTLSILGKDYVSNGAVVMSAQNDKEANVVIVFIKGMSFHLKTAIQNFVKKTLQGTMNKLIEQAEEDTCDYSQSVEIEVPHGVDPNSGFLIADKDEDHKEEKDAEEELR